MCNLNICQLTVGLKNIVNPWNSLIIYKISGPTIYILEEDPRASQSCEASSFECAVYLIQPSELQFVVHLSQTFIF